MTGRLAHPAQRSGSRGAPRGVLGALGVLAIVLGSCGPSGTGAAAPGAATGRVSGEPTPLAQRPSPRELVAALTRSGVGPGQVAIAITYATPAFFQIMELAPPTEMSERPTLAFMIEETVHDESLPDAPPGVQLVLPTGERASPYLALVTATDPHHRTTRLLFADARAAPIDPMAPDAQGSVILVVPFADGTVSAGNTFEWRLPIDLTPDATFNSPGASG